jgi:RES domain-containing protein
MEVYRIAQTKYSTSLNASGKEGRWNEDNQYVIYTSASRSLATLEKLVAFGGIHPIDEYKMMVIQLDDTSSMDSLSLNDLPADWQSVGAYHRLHGLSTSWYSLQQTLFLKVPSAIIQQECNFIINTRHPDFTAQVRIMQTENYFWDQRLF